MKKAVLFLMVTVTMVLVSACRSVKYVEVGKVSRDTVWRNHTAHDSIYLRDSVYVHEWAAGDTVYVERTRWLTKYVERLRTDTVYMARADTVVKPVVVEKEKGDSWVDKVKELFWTVAMMGAVLVLFVFAWKTK